LAFGLVHVFDDVGNILWEKESEDVSNNIFQTVVDLIAVKSDQSLSTMLTEKELKVFHAPDFSELSENKGDSCDI
jgi:hypothetical protein